MSNYINLPLSGLEEPLSEMEQYVQDTAHRFAVDVLRPIGTQLDAMSADEGVAPDSPLWGALQKADGPGSQRQGTAGTGTPGTRAHPVDRRGGIVLG